jgi:hypothetical protein
MWGNAEPLCCQSSKRCCSEQACRLNDSEYKIRALSFNQRVGADGEGLSFKRHLDVERPSLYIKRSVSKRTIDACRTRVAPNLWRYRCLN